MSVTLEKIEMLRERAHVTYEEAKEALEKCGGEIVDALIYLEKQDKIKTPQKENRSWCGFWAKVKRLLKKCHETRLVISKEGDSIIYLPLTVVLIITVFAAPVVIISLIAALFTRHKIRIKRPGGPDLKINKTLEDISQAASKVSDQFVAAVNKI